MHNCRLCHKNALIQYTIIDLYDFKTDYIIIYKRKRIVTL